MKLPHKQSNLHCQHNQKKQTKLQRKAGAYKRTRESNNGRLCFRLWHNSSIEHKLVKPKTRKHNNIANAKHTMVISARQKHELTLEIVAPMRSAPLLPQANSSNPNVTTTNGSARERGSKNKPATRNLKFPASARDLTAFTQDQSIGIFLNAFKRLLLIMETSWHLVYPFILGLCMKTTTCILWHVVYSSSLDMFWNHQ